MLTSVIILKSSPDTCSVVPLPPDAIIDLARIGLGKGNELGNRLGRNRWMYLHDERYANYAGDRRDVTDKIEIELVVECRIDRVGRTDDEQRIAVRGRTHGRLDGDIAAGPRP